MLNSSLIVVLVVLVLSINVRAYHLRFHFPKSIVLGSSINFSAELWDGENIAPEKKYIFSWKDNANPSNAKSFGTNKPYTNWTVEYPKIKYKPGIYKIRLDVQAFTPIMPIPYSIAEKSDQFNITEFLAGNLTLIQNETARKTEYVSSLIPLNQVIQLETPDLNYLVNKTTYYRTYWFENCIYMGQTNDLNYSKLYNKENEEYELEALVVGSFDVLPDPTTTMAPTSTTTPTTTTTATTPKTTTLTTRTSTESIFTSTSTAKSDIVNLNSNNSAPNEQQRVKRDFGGNITAKHNQLELEVSPLGVEIDVKNITKQLHDGLINQSQIAAVMSSAEIMDQTTASTINKHEARNYSNQPFVCLNKSVIAPDPNKTYGYFHRKIVVKIPVANLTVVGSNWLQHGEILNLRAKCTGSLPLEYCVRLFTGPYNVTGNETCIAWQSLSSCEFPFIHLFNSPNMYSVVFIVRNPVAKIVNQVAINFYEAKKQSQLSVIVVPVSFSLVAVILVVFGVAYYIQNKNRFAVEVADFNFGETLSVEMEYKTFQQRLLDSIREVVHRQRDRRDSDGGSSPSVESSLKYGSMT